MEQTAEEATPLRPDSAGTQGELVNWLHTLFYDSPVAIGFSRDGVILGANPAYLKLFGLGRGEIRGTPLLEHIAPTHRADIVDKIRKRVVGEYVPANYETRGVRTDGSEFPFEITTSRVPVGDGPLTIALITDISDRVRVRTELTEALELNQRALNTSTVGCLVYAADGPCIFANAAIGRIIGATHAQALAQNFREIPSWRPSGLLDAALRTLESGADQHGLFHLQTTFGKEIWLDCHLSRVTRAGQTLLFAFMRDATTERMAEAARRESEQRLDRALAAVNDAVWEWNTATGATFVSQRGHDLLDYAPGTEVAPLSEWSKQLVVDDRRQFDQVLRDYQTGARQAHQLEVRVCGASGRERWVLFRGRLVDRDETGRPVHVVGTLADVASQHELAERVRHAQKLESLGMLAGGIAHDFNNLLTTIIGSTELALIEAPAGSRLRGHLDTIGHGARRAAEFCGQMLAYAGKAPLEARPIDLSGLVAETGLLLDASVSSRASLQRELAPDLPAVVGDATQLRQVLLNLVINSSEALGAGGGVIRVATGQCRLTREDFSGAPLPADLLEGTYAWLEVEDSGCGMERSTVARMFEPFFTTKFTGRGLGMAAVAGIVRSHLGSIAVSSAPGRGTRTRVYLPARGHCVAPVEPAPAPAFRGQGTILLVDDQHSVRLTTRLLLQMLGFEVLEASGGVEALDLFVAHREKVVGVLLDLTMPEMNGTEVLAALRRIDSGVRVVLTTGFSTLDLEGATGSERANAVLGKPYTLEQLTEVLRRLTQ